MTISRNFGSPHGMKLIAWLMRFFPRTFVYSIAFIPVVWYYLKHSAVRRASAKYQKMLGQTSGLCGRISFGLRQIRAYSFVILDNMYLGIFGPTSFSLERLGTEVFRRTLENGRGLILLSAHVGNWHLAVNFLKETLRQVHLVMDDVRIEEVRRQMDMAKKASEHLVVHDSGQTGLVFELKTALERGEVVILAGDRATTGRRQVKIDFFGDKAWFPTTAYYLAAATGAPICTALALRTGMHRYDCYGLGPMTAKPIGTNGRGPAQVEVLARQFAGQLEQYLQRFPEQWFNFYDFWAD